MSVRTRLLRTFEALGVLLLLAAGARASRLQAPMGTYIRQAGLIVVADTERGGERGRHTVLHIREVIQGDAELAGQTVVLAVGPRSTADARLPWDAKGIAVLLAPGWAEAKEWPVVETYEKPEQLQVLRRLAPIYRVPGERDRLLALRGAARDGDPLLRKQFLEDLADMRDPASFGLITGSYRELRPGDQEQLVALIGRIGDVRGVPTLIEALDSPHEGVARRAGHALASAFPGAPGVTEAFERALERGPVARTAAEYLLRRRPDPELEAIVTPRETRWGQARRFLEDGEREAAREVYLAILRDSQVNFLSRMNAAEALLAGASRAEKEQVRGPLLELLRQEADENNHIFVRQAARALRALRHPDCLDALLRILARNDFIHRPAVRTALMAIRDLGAPVRQTATAHVLHLLTAPPPKSVASNDALRYVLELLWLGDAAAFRQAEQLMDPAYKRAWETLKPLQALAETDDEVALLLKLLDGKPRLPEEALDLIVLRLGELGDTRAVPGLIRTMSWARGWLLADSAAAALVAIGGPQVEEEMLQLLSHEDEGHVRSHAINVLFSLRPDRVLALSRRMLEEDDFGRKRRALTELGLRGTPDDLARVLPYCDYWRGDRQLHLTAMTAAARLRERHHYDLNGPIRIEEPTH